MSLSDPTSVQVAIVGAGPTGATLALMLARAGIRVLLVEAAPSFRRVFRGEGLMPSGLDALEQMGLMPVLEQVPHCRLDAWEFILRGRRLFRVEEPQGETTCPCTLVSQPPFLEALIREAQIYPHFQWIQGVAFQDLRWNGQRVAGIRLSDGQEISADLVIGADGRNSRVRRRAELPLKAAPHATDVLWFKLAAGKPFEAENVFYSILEGERGFAVFRGAEGDLHLAWLLFEDAPDLRPTQWAEEFAAFSPPWLATHFRSQAETMTSPVRLSVVVGRCPQWSRPGLLLLGDAAHPMSPIRAQGINLALRDVIVALNYLLPPLRAAQPDGAENAADDATDAVLPQIQAEREPEIIRAQQLQRQESAQAEKLRDYPPLRHLAYHFAPLIRGPLRYSWSRRQVPLRQGVTTVQFTQSLTQ